MEKEIYLKMRTAKMKEWEYCPLVVSESELKETVDKYKKLGFAIEIMKDENKK